MRATTTNLGFLLAKASQRWNELLVARFAPVAPADYQPLLVQAARSDAGGVPAPGA